jgi:hypothetical protein
METTRNFLYAKYHHKVKNSTIEIMEELTGRGESIFTVHKDLDGHGHHKECGSLKEVFEYLKID